MDILESCGFSVASTWLSCDSRLEDAYIAPMFSNVEAQIHKGEGLCAWEDYPLSVVFKEEDDRVRVN